MVFFTKGIPHHPFTDRFLFLWVTKRTTEDSISVKICSIPPGSQHQGFSTSKAGRHLALQEFSLQKITLSKIILLLAISTKLLIFLSSSTEPNQKDKSWFGIFWKRSIQFQTVSNTYSSEIVYFVQNKVKAMHLDIIYSKYFY